MFFRDLASDGQPQAATWVTSAVTYERHMLQRWTPSLHLLSELGLSQGKYESVGKGEHAFTWMPMHSVVYKSVRLLIK